MIHQSGRESASKCSFCLVHCAMCSPILPLFMNLSNRKIPFVLSTVSSATLNLNTLSKRCGKMVQLNLKSLEFRACPSCEYLNALHSALLNCLFLLLMVFYPRSLISCTSCRHDFQFFNIHRLTELYEKEVRYLMVGLSKQNACHWFVVLKRVLG